MDIAYRYSPTQANIYCIDLGAQHSLSILKDLPHLPKIGGHITGDETERIVRLFSMVRILIAERSEKIKGAEAEDIYHYNQKVGKSEYIPHVYLLIDNVTKQFEETLPGFFSQLLEIILSGRVAGIHVAITANLHTEIAQKIYDSIPIRIALRQSDDSQYSGIVGRPPAYLLTTPIGEVKRPGWGLLNSNPVLELQIALPVEGETSDLVVFNLNQIIRDMGRTGRQMRPPDVRTLPEHIYSGSLVDEYISANIPQHQTNILEIPMGIEHETLSEIGLSIDDESPIFYIGSTEAKKGKTTLIRTWLLELSRIYPVDLIKFIIIDYHTRQYGHFFKSRHADIVSSKADLESKLAGLKKEVEKRQEHLDNLYKKEKLDFDIGEAMRKFHHIVIVIDDLNRFRIKTDSKHLTALDNLISVGSDVGLRLIVAEKTSLLGSLTQPIVKQIHNYGCGILLGGSENIDVFNKAKLPFGQKTSNLIPGRGYLINRGNVQLFQASAYWRKEELNHGQILLDRISESGSAK